MCTFKWKYFKEEQDMKDWILISYQEKDLPYVYNLILAIAEGFSGKVEKVNMRYCEKCNKIQIETFQNSTSNKFEKIINKILNKDYRDFEDIRIKRNTMIKSILE